MSNPAHHQRKLHFTGSTDLSGSQTLQRDCILSILAASKKYFRAMTLPRAQKNGSAAAAVAAAAVSTTSTAVAKDIAATTNEYDAYYPQSWLINYFAYNGMHLSTLDDDPSRTSKITTVSDSLPPQWWVSRKLVAPTEMADSLLGAMVSCCRRRPVPDMGALLEDTKNKACSLRCFEVGASPDGTSKSLSPTITTTFCLLQVGMSVCRRHEDSSPSSCILDEASKVYYSSSSTINDLSEVPSTSSGSDCTSQQATLSTPPSTLGFEIETFALRRLRAFSDTLAQADRVASAVHEEIDSSTCISDPRDLYSALMILWLVHKDRFVRSNVNLSQTESESSIGDVFASLEVFSADTWESSKSRKAIRDSCLKYLLQSCYVLHEGAFGSPSLLNQTAKTRIVRAAEAHTGMTYCACVSLILLGYFSSYLQTTHLLNNDLSPGNLIREVRRYLCARQAHFGIDIDEMCERSVEDMLLSVFTFQQPGFQGRPNKDSDTCYSFWALGSFRAIAIGEKIWQHHRAPSHFSECVESKIDTWDALDKFINSDTKKGCMEVVRHQDCFTGLHHSEALKAFTLSTAGLTSTNKCHCRALPLICKDADEETTPDPVHSFLGMAGFLSGSTTQEELILAENRLYPFP